MAYKYLVLDFGKVIAGPTTGDWDITPKFLELIDINKLDMDKFKELRDKYGYMLGEQLDTLEQEYDMFFRFYDSILSQVDYPNYDKKLINENPKYIPIINIPLN